MYSKYPSEKKLRGVDICPRISCPYFFPDGKCKYIHANFISPILLIKKTENLFILISEFLELFFSKPLQKIILSYADLPTLDYFKLNPQKSLFDLEREISNKLQFVLGFYVDFQHQLKKRYVSICKSCRCKINIYYLDKYFEYTRESEYCRDCSIICSIEGICKKYTCNLCKKLKCKCEMEENRFRHCKECVKLWNY